MPAQTPILKLPYPLSSDQVAEGAADMQALAERLEALFGTPVAPAMTSKAPANPPAIGHADYRMAGLAGTITPVRSGNVVFSISYAKNSWQLKTRFAYDAGATAPKNGDPATGIVLGPDIGTSGGAYVYIIPVPGLTRGQPYWFDLWQCSHDTGICQMIGPQLSAWEL